MIIELPHHGLSNSAAARSKHWIKQLTGVDTSKSDGYAFMGTFARFGATVEVPGGTWFLSYVADVSGSGRLRCRDVVLYRAGAEGLSIVETWNLDEGAGWALKVRDEIAGLMNASRERTPLERTPLEKLQEAALSVLAWGCNAHIDTDPLGDDAFHGTLASLRAVLIETGGPDMARRIRAVAGGGG